MVIGPRTAFAHAPIDGRVVTEFEPDGKVAGEMPALSALLWPAPAPPLTLDDYRSATSRVPMSTSSARVSAEAVGAFLSVARGNRL